MKKILCVDSQWKLCRLNSDDLQNGLLCSDWWTNGQNKKDWFCSEKAESVHEILLKHGVLEQKILLGGDCSSYQWVSESDWLYHTEFAYSADEETESVFLTCNHVDTCADIYFNRMLVASHDDSFLPLHVDVTSLLQQQNMLTIHFKSPIRVINELAQTMPEEWKGHIDPSHLLRKACSTLGSFLGARPCVATVGLAAPVNLACVDQAYFSDLHITSKVSQWLDSAVISFDPQIKGAGKRLSVRCSVIDSCGKRLHESELISCGSEQEYKVKIESPQLWWPRPFGEQPLYSAVCELYDENKLLDRREKKIGLRKIECSENFDVKVNNCSIRLWGANFVNLCAMTQGWDTARGEEILKQVVDCNMNTLRVWGEAPQLADEFYDFCDRHGILVWQDFYIGYGLWPDSPEYLEKYRLEAEHMVKRLRHHPSIFMWCGSNESYMYGMSVAGEYQTFGFDIVFKVVRHVCRALDPDRFYHVTSPSGGDYPQSPYAGDIHGYNRINFEPGSKYPVLFSEYCHMTPMARHSMLKIMSEEELFPKKYINRHLYEADFSAIQAVKDKSAMVASNYWRTLPLPETWKTHLSVFSPADIDDIQDYYDAEDGDSLLYRYGACAADTYRLAIDRARRGRPSHSANQPCTSRGLLVWKLNDIFPHMDFTLIDAFLEPTVAYYAVKRGFSPLRVSVHVEEDHLYLWAYNDTNNDFNGKIVFRVFERINNRINQEQTFQVRLKAGETQLVANLDFVGPIRLDCLLHAQMLDINGSLVSSDIAALDKECNLPFPDANLSLRLEGDELVITTDQYARYIELTGDDNGDAFGWHFEDNYFDLLPFEEKRVKVSGRHSSGMISAKAHYSSKAVQIFYDTYIDLA